MKTFCFTLQMEFVTRTRSLFHSGSGQQIQGTLMQGYGSEITFTTVMEMQEITAKLLHLQIKVRR